MGAAKFLYMKSTAASVWIQKAAQFLTLIFALFPLCQLEAQETPLPYPLDLSAHYSSKFTTPKGTNNYYRNIAGPLRAIQLN